MKINCTNPEHDDRTPSMHVYSDGAYCFVCGHTSPLEEVISSEEIRLIKKDPEDVYARLKIIKQLPKGRIRGLLLPRDASGYYIIWPDNSFYKKRRFNDTPRYYCPRGNKPPLFFYQQDQTSLVIVEGELNAKTVFLSTITSASICSPGSAGELLKHLSKYLTFKNILIIVDKDAVGVAYGLELKALLLKSKKKVTLNAVEKDANQILQDSGFEGVREWFKNLDMPEGV